MKRDKKKDVESYERMKARRLKLETHLANIKPIELDPSLKDASWEEIVCSHAHASALRMAGKLN